MLVAVRGDPLQFIIIGQTLQHPLRHIGFLAAVMNHLAGAATEDAVWLHTDFAMPEKGLARLRSQAVHALMYAFFRVFTALPARKLTAPDREFARHGFERSRRADFEWGLIRAELWQRREKIA